MSEIDLKTCQRIDPNIKTLTEQELREIARNFDAWYCHDPGIDEIGNTYVAILRDENPNMFIGFYENVNALADWDKDLMPQAKDYWFLKDENGNIIRNNYWPQMQLLDIGHPEVQQALADNCKEYFDRWGYDFMFADDFTISLNFIRWGMYPNLPVNPRTGHLYTDNEWYNDRVEFLRITKNTIGSKKVVANICWDIFSDPNLPIFDELDGTLWEDTKLRSEEQIEQMLPVYQQWSKNNKVWLNWLTLPSDYPEEQMSMYRLCFHLLCAEDESYLTIRGNEEYPNQYKGQLGQPLQDYHKITETSVYARKFKKAWVLFNASPDTYIVTVDGVEVVIEEHTGKIVPI